MSTIRAARHVFIILAGFLAIASEAFSADAFFNAGQLEQGRNSHTATVLADGKVLIAGGKKAGGNTPVSSAEIYDPATGTSVLTGSLAAPRSEHAAVLLPSGKVLVTGEIASAELYDPATGTWQDASPAEDPFVADSSTLLGNGKVLVIGGTDATTQTSKAILYDPLANSWTATGSLATVYGSGSAVLLQDGRVLVAGGREPGTNTATVASDIYDPASGVWTATGSLGTPRNSPNLQRLANGKVIAITGSSGTAEIFDPATGSWSPTGSFAKTRGGFSAVPLADGTVLVTGGFQSTTPLTTILASSEVYDPATGNWKRVDSMNTLRCLHQATLLDDGSVLITGGWGYHNPSVFGNFNHGISQSEIYQPVAGQWTAIASMNRVRQEHTTTLLGNGKVLVTGGIGDTPDNPHPNHKTGPIPWAEILDPATGIWSETGSMASARYDHTAILLPGGSVLAVSSTSGSAEAYAPDTGGWTAAGLMPKDEFPYIQRSISTLLQDGKVIITGSTNGSAQIHDPVTKNSILTPSGGPQGAHTATLLADGRVLTVEGFSSIKSSIYNPLSNTWSPTGSPLEPRYSHSACLLPSGKILICGGLGFRDTKSGFPLTSAEIFDPATGKWTAASPTGKSRLFPSLIRFGDGRILATGGQDNETSNTAEIYDETTNTWAPTAPLGQARSHFSLTPADGGILATGGLENTILATAEIYDPPFPEIAVEQPAGTDFGTVIAGSAKTMHFTIRNVGTSGMTGLSAAKSGPNAADFHLEMSGGNLAPGAAKVLAVRFKPTSAGNKSATVHLDFNDIGGSTFDIRLTGKGVALTPEISVEQPPRAGLTDGKSKRSFGTVKIGKSGTAKIFTIRNAGTGVLTGLSVGKNGGDKNDFQIGKLGKTTLAPGASTTFKVTFKPRAQGKRNATLRIGSNDADENPFDIKLTGRAASR